MAHRADGPTASGALTVVAALLVLLAPALAGCLAAQDDAAGGAGAAPPANESGDPGPLSVSSPEDSSSAGDGRHVHDYWGERTEAVLMRGPVQSYLAHNHLLDEPPREQHLHNCERELASTHQGGSVFFSFPPGHMVYPGTDYVVFTFAWTSPTITSLAFGYISPASPELTMVGTVDSGNSLVVEVDETMTDPGHATKSRWLLYLCASGDAPASVAEGQVNIRAVAHRGKELPLEPAHPDFWEEGSDILVARGQARATTVGALSKGEGAVWVPLPTLPGTIVPPDAKEVLVWSMLHTSGMSPLPPTELVLYVNHPGMGPYNWTRVEGEQANDTWSFRIPVTVDTSDGMYTDASFWRFWLRASSTTQRTPYGTWSVPFTDTEVQVDGMAFALEAAGQTPHAIVEHGPCHRGVAC